MLTKIKGSRLLSFILIFCVYVITFIAGLLIFNLNESGNDILFIFIADIIATVIIWGIGILFNNSSFYDAYWSVAPIAILTPLAYYYGVFSLPCILMLIAIWFWGIRLTVNWMITFPNLYHQDWRYVELRKNYPGKWQLVNFGGIHLMPTLIVFLTMLPAFYITRIEATANVFTYLGFTICIASAVLQWISDNQMHRFRREGTGKVLRRGVWKYSRHPNYLGEIAFWWGIFFITLSVAPQYWWTGIGALANSCLFIFISIPLMENRQSERKPDYANYIKEVPMLIPGKKR